MKKHFATNYKYFATLVLISTVSVLVFPNTTHAAWFVDQLLDIGTNALLAPVGAISLAILQLANLITYLSGIILNYVVIHTVVNMGGDITGGQTLNNVVAPAWTVIRDIANMSFIFILLYAAIKTILGIGSDSKKVIVRVIIVAILINFSLFFTKLVIDIANVFAIFLYDAIAPGALSTASISIGLSSSLMDPLDIQSLWDIEGLFFDGKKMIIIGIMGTIVSLVAAFIFFAMTIMLVIRYVVLIFVMILSPIAFMGFVLPELKSKILDKWKDALIGQAFFAPIFFLLTWVVLVVSKGLLATTNGTLASAIGGRVDPNGGATVPQSSDIAILVNFIVMIAFMIASLVISKEWANKAPVGVSKITSWAMGAASGAAAWSGRQTIGRTGAALAGSANLQQAAKEKTGLSGAGARLALYAGRKARSGSFNLSNAAVPTSTLGDVVEGTVGRTRIGKALGLNDVNIPSIKVGSYMSGVAGLPQGEKKGFVELQSEKDKRIREREKTDTDELKLAQAKKNIGQGSKAGATPAEIAAMEKALSGLNDKQTESLVASNRELLESQNFANSISVKQLEAINKSDQFSDAEKDNLKSNRFSDINTAMAPGGGGATTVSGKIKALSDTELEMMDPTYISNPDFVGQMRAGQIDAVNKSSKFTTSQKEGLKTARQQPLLNALRPAAGAPVVPATVQTAVRRLNPKELISLMRVPGRTTPGGVVINAALDPAVLPLYTPQILKRMAPDMDPAEIQTLRNELIGPPQQANGATFTWLTTGAGLNEFN